MKQSDDQIRAQIFKALSDESRLAIIRTLYVSGKELSCGEVGEKCNIVKTTASYHFKTLREAGLTATRKIRGQNTSVCVKTHFKHTCLAFWKPSNKGFSLYISVS